jgi:hypothetical protein
MNPPTTFRRWYHRIWIYVLGAMVASAVLVSVGVYNLVTLTNEASVLKRSLFAADRFDGSLRVQGTVGPVLLSGARMVTRFIPDIPPEVREALGAVRSASVGIYELDVAPTAKVRNEVFVEADAAMERSGWTRIVSVSERHQRVAVYTPAEDVADERQIRICVAVCDHKQLVLVSARADARKLSEFAQRQIPKVL